MTNRTNFRIILAAVLITAAVAQGQSAATVTILASQPGAVVSTNLFGIFFEEINYAGEGGIYAEMVRNRAFYNPSSALFWTLLTQGTATGTMIVDSGRPLNTNIPNSLKLTMQSGTGSVGAGNDCLRAPGRTHRHLRCRSWLYRRAKCLRQF